MEKEFIPYEQALALKELGFDKPCFKGYTEEYKTLISFSNTHTNTSVKNTLPTKPFTAPLYQQAFRWFREKHDLNSFIENDLYEEDDEITWFYTISTIKDAEDLEIDLGDGFKIYEEVELECLKKLIEIIKTKYETSIN